MIPSVSAARARSARIAVSTLFFASGVLVSSYLPRLPEIRDGLGLTNAELGAAIAALPIGGLLAGGFAGVLIARFGSGRVGAVAGVAAALAVVAIGQAPSWPALALSFLVLGVFDAVMDASQNSHGVGVQRVYGRSILQGLHGMWAVGGLASAALGALAASAGIPVAAYLAAVGIVVAIGVVGVSGRFLPREVADAPAAEDAEAPPLRLRSLPWLLRILAPIALLGILCILLQSAATTWSAIYLKDDLGQPAGVAAAGVRGLHGRDGRRPVHQRPLDRPLGPDVGRPGRRADLRRGHGHGHRRRAAGRVVAGVRGVCGGRLRLGVHVPGDGRDRRDAAGHPGRPRDRHLHLAGAPRARDLAGADRGHRGRARPPGGAADPARGRDRDRRPGARPDRDAARPPDDDRGGAGSADP